MAHQQLRVLVGSLAPGVLPSTQPAKMPAGTIMLDLGSEHPSHAGLIELRLWTEDDVITTARVVVGAMHRGAEKLFEVRDYRQILMLADRHDWQAPFFGELAVAMICEQMMGLTVPDRAVWLRTLLAEHTRILSHCGFLVYVPHRLSRDPGLRDLREQLRTQTLRLTGNRIHPMATRVGGLGVDADDAWLRAERQVAEQASRMAEAVLAMIDSAEFSALTSGVAVLDRDTIGQFGVSGPAARASGVDLDLRRQRPYLAYAELAGMITPPTRHSGDAHARLGVLAGADHQRVVDHRLHRATPGPVRSGLCQAGQDHPHTGGRGLCEYRGASRHRRRVSGLSWREDPVATQAAYPLVQQHLLPGDPAGGRTPRIGGGYPGLDRLRRRRHRQMTVA